MKASILFVVVLLCNILCFAQNKIKTKPKSASKVKEIPSAIKAAPQDTNKRQIFNTSITDTTMLKNIVQVKPDTMAQFNGGNDAYKKFLNNYLIYPQSAVANGEQGKVYVRFIVCEDGSLCNIQIIDAKSVASQSLRNEAIRIVRKTPNWKPAMLKGQAIKSYFELPINFKLLE